MYKSRRRPWVKLYCREWLTSTVRFDLTESDRSRFIDLLALAGDSKVPGVVCSGYDGSGKLSGYPIDWLASTMRCGIGELQESLEKFKKSDRVTVSGPPDSPAIRISSWKRYQSEYLRQVEAVKSRETSKNKAVNGPKISQTSAQFDAQSSLTSTQLPRLEVEVEVEVEKEGEYVSPQVEKHMSSSPPVGNRFEEFWELYPKKEAKKPAARVWAKMVFEDRLAAMAGVRRWIASGRWADPQYIPLATSFLNQRRWEDEIIPKHGGQVGESKAEQQTKRNAAAIVRSRGLPRPVASDDRRRLPAARNDSTDGAGLPTDARRPDSK